MRTATTAFHSTTSGPHPASPVTFPHGCAYCGGTHEGTATCEAIGAAVLERVSELIKRRDWYARHIGWIPQQRVDDMAELRALLRFARAARRQVEADTVWHLYPQPIITTGGWTEPELREAWGDR